MTRRPKTSTLNNFTTAWNRVIATAVERGFISERVPVPIAEVITGHGRNASEFARYGSVGYTLVQKKAVIERILV